MLARFSKYTFHLIAAFAVVYFIWGSTYLAIRFTIETLPLYLSAGARFIIAGSILYGFARVIKKESKPTPVHWRSAAIIGGLLLLGGNGSVTWAEQYVPSGITALFLAVMPLWMVLLEWWWNGTKPATNTFIGIGIGFFGIWMLIAPGLGSSGDHGLHGAGVLALLCASMSWAAGSVYARRAPMPATPWLGTGMEMLCGGILLFVTGILRGESFNPAAVSVKSAAAFVYLIFFGALLGFTAYIWLVKNAGVARTSTHAFVNPVVAVLLGWAFAGERLDLRTAAAAFLVIAAVAVITVYRQR